MKRFLVPLLVVAVAAAAFAYRDHFLPQPQGHLAYLGYVEGETALIAAPQAGRLVSVSAVKGEAVRKGDTLFALDPVQAEAEVARAKAAILTAQAAHDNLLTGKRAEEIAVIQAQIAQAEASLELAKKEMQRASMLASTGTAARARLDQAEEQQRMLEARIIELKASEKVASLPARGAEIDAATARIAEAEAQLASARDRLSNLSPAAPAAARVEDVFFKPGEWVAAGQPVVSLLAPNDVTLRFFIPQSALAAAAPGTAVTFSCDGCAPGKSAVITRVASEPEYTPPVIYSQEARAKLVYLVEAKPDAADPQLRPGLPIAVDPLP